MLRLHRRHLLASAAALVFSAPGRAAVLQGSVPWMPAAGSPPKQVLPGPWQFFTPAEGELVEALVDRLIPPDEWAGGKEAGVAVFIDRQLAGPFGRADGNYMQGPFKKGTPEQGDQSPLTPAEQYRKALAGLDAHCKARFSGAGFASLSDGDKDGAITDLEHGEVKIDGVEAKAFFQVLLKNAQEGYFADPIYGGNRDMVSWRMIGFPGARYDFSDWIGRHNQRYPHGPISIAGAPDWTAR